jgi:hypothetical protein
VGESSFCSFFAHHLFDEMPGHHVSLVVSTGNMVDTPGCAPHSLMNPSVHTPFPSVDLPLDPQPRTVPPDPPPTHNCAPTSSRPIQIVPTQYQNDHSANQQGARNTNYHGIGNAITLLAWTGQGSGGSLKSSKMLHLHRLVTSTKSKVIFISETRISDSLKLL